MYISRAIEPLIKKNLFKGKVVVIYGARQVGKTTLVRKIASEVVRDHTYINGDDIGILSDFQNANSARDLRAIVGRQKLVVIDEAQRIKNIGLKLKLLVDNYPEQQVIATGSSSFDLANEINEPLTGRNFEYWLYPFTLREISGGKTARELDKELGNLLVYGSYPGVYQLQTNQEKTERIKLIASDYLFKDIINFENLKSSDIVLSLLQLLALQVGNEVSYNELAATLGIAKQTVGRYIDLLEKIFVIFRLLPYSLNQRKAIGKKRKIYFFDLGIRDAIINSFNPPELRDDVGKLWENFVIGEKFKFQAGPGYKTNYYFWRTYDKQEVNLVEMEGGKMHGWEIKWGGKEKKAPIGWRESFKNQTFRVINRENFQDFLR